MNPVESASLFSLRQVPRPSPPDTDPASRRGFTLAELLVVTLILALVVGVLGACISAGIRVLVAARGVNVTESSAALGFEIIEKDLVNTFPFYAVAFEGDARDVVFPGIVETVEDGELRESLGRISYSFDREKGLLLRAAWAFPGERSREHRPDTIVEDLEEIVWGYADIDDGVAWMPTWSDVTNHPDVVRVELVFRAPRGRDRQRFSRMVVLPRARREGQ